MVTMHGLALKARRNVRNDDRSSARISSLYLGPSKVATVLEESGVEGCESSTQVFVRHPYSEEKLRRRLAELHPDQPDFGPEALVEQMNWLASLEIEFMRHADRPNGGMLALQLEGGQVTLRIPLKLATATEEEILSSCQELFQRYQALYGPLQGYLIFHTLDDFQQGPELQPQELLK